MQILLVAATENEIAPFLAKKPSADYLVTGVGCPITIYQLSKRLHHLDYDLVIQAGIAGSFSHALPLGEVVLVKRDCFADLGIVEENGLYSLFDKGFADENHFPFTKGWLENENPLLNNIFLQHIDAVTVNTVTDEAKQIERMVSKYNPLIETMEGAALHFVCLQENVPFLQLRSISNFVGERNKSNWKLKESIEGLNDTLIQIMDELTS
jgi:futalosine hydrolase